ncbi:hypothetical protein SAY86_030360 [Trapa natans]|uniref:Pentatricopeptide repeat-containing protein n=1 Tax=Trapa natans TaxID=22666 RepID=A0AAN7RAI8_TRANT|nr:hypothetical protein SAY86_030360 [Trapa natans]
MRMIFLMDMYTQAGDCWKAEEVLGRIQSLGRTPDLISYNTVIKGFRRQGLMQEAIGIFSEMSGRGIRPCIVTYNTFISGYAAREMFAEIDDVVEYMFQHGYRLNELTCKIIVNGYCKAGSVLAPLAAYLTSKYAIFCQTYMYNSAHDAAFSASLLPF